MRRRKSFQLIIVGLAAASALIMLTNNSSIQGTTPAAGRNCPSDGPVPAVVAAADGLAAADAWAFASSAIKHLDPRTIIYLLANPSNTRNTGLYGLGHRHPRIRIVNVTFDASVPCNGGEVRLSVYLARFAELR